MSLGPEGAGLVEGAFAEMGRVDGHGWKLLLWAAGLMVHLYLQELPLRLHLEGDHHGHLHVGAYHDPCKSKKC